MELEAVQQFSEHLIYRIEYDLLNESILASAETK